MEFQRYPFKYPNTKYVYFIHRWKFNSSQIKVFICIFEMPPESIFCHQLCYAICNNLWYWPMLWAWITLFTWDVYIYAIAISFCLGLNVLRADMCFRNSPWNISFAISCAMLYAITCDTGPSYEPGVYSSHEMFMFMLSLYHFPKLPRKSITLPK